MKKSIPETLLIVGLGNPGEQYNGTPHNAGFLVVDELIKRFRVEGSVVNERQEHKSEIYEIKMAKTKLILAKPQTFMNKSGEAVKALITNYSPRSRESGAGKLPITSALWVVHDDVDLSLGQIKIVKNRGSAGHKGVEDVIRKLKTRDFVRFRMGIRPKRIAVKRPKAFMNKFVASTVSKAEQALFKKTIKRIGGAIILAIEEGIEKAANLYN